VNRVDGKLFDLIKIKPSKECVFATIILEINTLEKHSGICKLLQQAWI
jgi:hypothetical protein